MTSATPDPSARNRISSTPVLRAALVWGMVVGVVVAAAMARTTVLRPALRRADGACGCTARRPY